MKPSPENGGGWVKPTFSEISERCPWRDVGQCIVLWTAERYRKLGGANCSPEHCAVFYWIKEMR